MNIKKIMLFVFAAMTLVNIAQGMNLIKKAEVECSICGEDEDCYVSTCHSNGIFCLDCRKHSIDAQLDNNTVPHCIARGCTQELSQGTINLILKNDRPLFNRYDAFMMEKWKRENGIKSCPTPNCKGEFDSRSGGRSHQCDLCHQHYCPTCEFDHRGITCDAARAAERRCPDCDQTHARNITCEAAKRIQQGEENLDTKDFQEKNIQKCPNCDAPLEKTSGCNHMTCGQCRHQFCWICLADWFPIRQCSCQMMGVDHRGLADQLRNAEEQLARENRGSAAYQQLEQQRNNIIQQRNQIEEQRARVREIESQKKMIKNIIFAASSLGVIAGYIAYTTVYQTWSQKRKLDLIAHTAENNVEKILAIEFELFDENNSLLTLQEQFDIDAILKCITSDEKRDALKSAIAAYDQSLKEVHYTVSSTKYYHQTPEYFAKNEPKLVGDLYTNLDTLKEVIHSCQSDISVDWKKLIGMSGLFAGAAVGAKLYFDR